MKPVIYLTILMNNWQKSSTNYVQNMQQRERRLQVSAFDNQDCKSCFIVQMKLSQKICVPQFGSEINQALTLLSFVYWCRLKHSQIGHLGVKVKQ